MKTLSQILQTLFVASVLSACGGGEEAVATKAPVVEKIPESEPEVTTQSVTFSKENAKQKVAGRVIRASEVIEAGLLNSSGSFRAPSTNTVFNGNLSASISVADEDGIARVFLTFDARDTVLTLCQSSCGTEFSTTTVGIKPANFGLTPGQHNFEIWVEDSSSNLQRVDSVPITWTPSIIGGLVAEVNQQQNSMVVSWDSVPNALRYNLYFANESGVNSSNFSTLQGGQARLSLSQTSVTLTDIGSEKNFFLVVSGVDGSGESAYSDEIKVINNLAALTPELEPDSLTLAEDSEVTFDLLANDEPHDETYQVTLINEPASGTATITEQGSLTYRPNLNFFGSDQLTYQVENSEGLNAQATVSIDVTAVNDAPIAVDDSFPIEDGATSLSVSSPGVLANDMDFDGTAAQSELEARIINAPSLGSLTLSSDGGFQYSAQDGFSGYDEFTYEVVDTSGATSSATVKIQASGTNGFPPVAVADSYSVNEDELLQVSAASGLLANDSDKDNPVSELVLEIVSPPANGELTLNSDGSFSYQGKKDFFGEDLFSYSLSDANDNKSQASVTIAVTGQNDVPVSAPELYAVERSNTFSVGAGEGVLANDIDPDKDDLTVDVATVTPPSSGSFQIETSGAFTYTPSVDFSGTDSFTYRAFDGELFGNSTTVQLQVPEVRFKTGNNAELVIYSQSQLPAGVVLNSSMFTLSSGSISINNGEAIYQAASGFVGLALVKVAYSTNAGSSTGANNGEVVEFFYIDVTGPNQAPELSVSGSSYVVVENQLDVTKFTATDPDNDELTFSVEGTDAGLFEITDDGSLRFASAPNFEKPTDANGNNVYLLDVKVTDDGVPAMSASESIVVVITNINESPKITSKAPATAQEGTVYQYTPVVEDDDDLNNGTDLTWSLVGAPEGMAISSTGAITWEPPAETNQTFNLTLSVIDGGEDGSNAATEAITIELTSVDDAPVIQNQELNVGKGKSVQFDWRNFATDPESDTISFDAFSSTPNNGQVTELNGIITYTHDNSDTSSDTFSYTVKANNLVSTTPGVVNINVTGDNTPPSINSASSFTVNENLPVGTLVYTATVDEDPENDPITWSIITDPQGIFIINSTSGLLTVANNVSLNYESVQSYTMIIKAEDNLGNRDTHNINVVINNLDEPPKLAASVSLGINENHATGTSAGLVATAVDPEGDAYTIELIDNNGVLTSSPTLISLVESPVGSFTVQVDNAINFEDLVATHGNFDEDASSNSYTYTVKLKAKQTSDTSLYTEQDLKVVINDVVESTELEVASGFGDNGFLQFNPYADISNNEYLVDAKTDRHKNVYLLIKAKTTDNEDYFTVAKYKTGVLDKTFGVNGIKHVFPSNQNDENVVRFGTVGNLDGVTATKLILHDKSGSAHDGKVYIVGSQKDYTTINPMVIRLNADGNLDSTFNSDGKYENSALTDVTGVDLVVHSNNNLYFAMNTLTGGSDKVYVEALNADTGASLGAHGTYDFLAGSENFGKSLIENSLGELVSIGYLTSSGNNDVYASRLNSTVAGIAANTVIATSKFDIKEISENNTSSDDVINGAIKIDASNAIIYGSTNYKSNTHQDSMLLKLNIDTLTLYGDSETECTTNNNCFGSEDANTDTKPDGVSIFNISSGNSDEVISAAINNNGDITFITKASDSTKFPLSLYQTNNVGVATSTATTLASIELAEKQGSSTGGVTDSNVFAAVLQDPSDATNNIHVASSKQVENLHGTEIETWNIQYTSAGSSDLNSDGTDNDVAVIQDHFASKTSVFKMLLEPNSNNAANQFFYGFSQTEHTGSNMGLSINRFDKATGVVDKTFNGNATTYEWKADLTNNKSYSVGGEVILSDQTVVTAVLEDAPAGAKKIIIVRRNADGTAYTGADLPSGKLEFSKSGIVNLSKLLYDSVNNRLSLVATNGISIS